MDDDQENQFPPIKEDHQKLPVSGSSDKTPSSGEGKLWIKLKLPAVVEDQIRPQRNDQPRVCNVCNKGFSSGKALGGHMRVHFQVNKEFFLTKLKTNHRKKKFQQRPELADLSENRGSNNATNARLTGNERPTCSLCGKDFRSMKSLFGHMRCHPEREWRGIQPPPAAKNSSASSVSDAEPIDSDGATMEIPVDDLTVSLPRWSATARRGRKALIAAASFSAPPPLREEQQLRDGVHNLMSLAHGDSLDSGLTHKHRVEAYEATNSNSMTNKAEIEDKNWVSESKKRRIEESPGGYRVDYPVKKLKINEDKGTGKSVLEEADEYTPEKLVGMGYELVNADWDREDDDYKNFTDDESDSSIPMANYKCESINGPVMIKKSKKRRKKMKLMDLESVREATPMEQIQRPIETTTTPPDRYKCSTCNKCFPTHQALGGHRSSHNKAKNNNHTIDGSSSAAAEDELHHSNLIGRVDDETKENEGAGSSKLAETTHHCKICNKTFPTGQALGGHKRCHWTGPAEAPASQAASPGEASQTGHKIVGFDLNELPAVEDEEVESEHGYVASSSHNSVA